VPRSPWWLVLAATVVVLPAAGRAATFDPRGNLHLDADTVMAVSFESAEDLVARGVKLYTSRWQPMGTTVASVGALLVQDDASLEGVGHVAITRSQGAGAAAFSLPVPLVQGRVEVRLWTKAAPGLVSLTAMWGGEGQQDLMPLAAVVGVATGRRTSDDWVELTSGPLDSHVMGVPLSSLFVAAGYGTAMVDALEVRRVGEALFPQPVACSAVNLEERCGEQGDCVYGTCVDGAAVWGAVPSSEALRQEYVSRLAHIFTRLHGNRLAVTTRGTAFAMTVASLARETSPRRFHGGVARAVREFRDHHTSPPMNYISYQASLSSALGVESSGALGACFGLTDLDLLGGGRGYTVFRTDADGGKLGVRLRVGDVLVAIDGVPVDGWLRDHAWMTVGGAPSDPASDPPWLALELPGLVSVRANTLELLRCESPTSCARPQLVAAEVNPQLRTRMLAAGHVANLDPPFLCDGRFLDSVSVLAPPPDDGGDAVSYELQDGVMSFQFNGFSGSNPWTSAFSVGLGTRPGLVLMDARLGNGGTADLVDFLVRALRDDTSPRVSMAVEREWQALDPDGFFDRQLACLGAEQPMLFDGCSGTMVFTTYSTPATAAGTRVAWVNSADVSANDFTPRMFRDRPGLRVFGPTPTSGAFGAVGSLPPLLPGEAYGGSIQVQDSRFARGPEQLAHRPYESGVGVPPDEVVVQTLSDALAGRDTIIARARAWLKEAP
jgi:hypothetical protein